MALFCFQRFTRVQRVSVCFLILFLTMMIDAVFYEIFPEEVSEGIRLGPVILSGRQIFIGILSNLITLIPGCLMVFLFKTARRYNLRKNR